MNVRTAETKESHLNHLFLTTEGKWCDRYIENMFHDLFNGDPLDDLFKNNFRHYFNFLTRYKEDEIPDEVFTDSEATSVWVSKHFGIVRVRPITLSETREQGPGFEHCKYSAMLRFWPRGMPDKREPEECYAPTETGAILLTVVNLFRHIAQPYIDMQANSVKN